VSLDAQRAKAAAYTELYDLVLCEVIVNAGESAKSLDRPGLRPTWPTATRFRALRCA
jgi:site-specific DNA recombinase